MTDQSKSDARSGDAVCLNGIVLERGGTALFDGLDIDMRARRIGIVGRNGAGKSQMARLIAGLNAPDTGKVTVCGVEVARDRKGALGAVGILFQNPDHQIIFPTVEEELLFGLRAQRMAKSEALAKISAMLETVGHGDWGPRAVHTLSGGQRHLVCLMSVLLMRPKVIVLDEPFAGLDLGARLRLARLLERSDAMILHISHDLEALESYDEVLWIDRPAGAHEPAYLRAQGPAKEVLTAYRSEMEKRGGGDDFTDL